MKYIKLLILAALTFFSGSLFSQDYPDIIITNVNIVDEGCVVENNFIWAYQELEVTVSNIGTEAFSQPYSVTSELAFSGEQISASSNIANTILQPGESIVLSGTLLSINTSWSIGQSNMLTVSLDEGSFTETGDALLNNTYEIFQTEDVDCSDLSIIDIEHDAVYSAPGCNPTLIYNTLEFNFSNPNYLDTLYSICSHVEILNTNTSVVNEFDICFPPTFSSNFPTTGSFNVLIQSLNIPIDGDTYQFTSYITDYSATFLDGNAVNDTVSYTIDTSIYDYDNCVYGCTDPEATNYDSTADVDDGSCNYTIIELTYLNSTCSVDCDATGAFYYVNAVFENTGNVTITDFCTEWNVISGGEYVECFTGSLIPGQTTTLTYGPISTDGSGVGWFYIQELNDNILNPETGFYEAISCLSDAEATCVYGCTDNTACNFDATADFDDATCTYVDEVCETCENGIVVDNDADNDGVCDADEINGCTDETACNYNLIATEDDDSCILATGCDYCSGETNGTGTVIDGDTDNDGVCNDAEIPGCTDETACNYDATATDEDNSCTFIDGVCDTCVDGQVIDNDADNDGTCDDDETIGCTDPAACNVGSFTDTDNTLCTYVDGVCETCVDGAIIDNDIDNDGVCDADEIAGCTDNTACNYNNTATDEDGTCTFPTGCETCVGGVIIDNDADNDGVCDNDEVVGCTNPTACNYNDDPTTDTDNTLCTFAIGCDTCSGETDGTGTVVDGDVDDDGVCNNDEVIGCTDQPACNWNAYATEDDGSCIYPNPDACEECDYVNFPPDGNGVIVTYDADGDGVCDGDEVVGCTDETACNYDATATDDDGSCISPTDPCDICDPFGPGIIDGDTDGDGICDEDEVLGCTDPTACNYDANATDDDGSCEPNVQCINGNTYDCNGDLIPNCVDSDGDGVCDTCEIPGCLNDNACNYNANATDDNADCDFTTCAGCLDPIACNYDATLTIYDPSACDYSCHGCTDIEACNYDPNATYDDGTFCEYPQEGYDCECQQLCLGDVDQNGIISTADLLIFLGEYGTICDE